MNSFSADMDDASDNPYDDSRWRNAVNFKEAREFWVGSGAPRAPSPQRHLENTLARMTSQQLENIVRFCCTILIERNGEFANDHGLLGLLARAHHHISELEREHEEVHPPVVNDEADGTQPSNGFSAMRTLR